MTFSIDITTFFTAESAEKLKGVTPEGMPTEIINSMHFILCVSQGTRYELLSSVFDFDTMPTETLEKLGGYVLGAIREKGLSKFIIPNQ